jgi:hypothetical protein
MRRGTSFDANQARRQLLEECQDVTALQLAAEDYLALRINAVNLKNRLRDIKADGCDCLHDQLLRIVGPQQAPTSMALMRRGRSRPQHHNRTFDLVGSRPQCSG